MRFRRWACSALAVSLLVSPATRASPKEHTVRNNPGMMAAGIIVGGLGMLLAGIGSWQAVEAATSECPPREMECLAGFGNSIAGFFLLISAHGHLMIGIPLFAVGAAPKEVAPPCPAQLSLSF